MHKEKYLSTIRANPFFQNISPLGINLLLNHSYIKHYKEGAIIHLQNEPCISLDLILEGDIIIQKIEQDGKVLTVIKFQAGDTFGENLIFADHCAYPMTIVALSNSAILHIDKNLIIDLCQNDKDFLNSFIRSISNKAILVSNKLNTLTMKSIREKIIAYLSEESKRQNSLQIELHQNRKEWAESLGIPRPSLSRELGKMKSDGLITYSGKWIFIEDAEILEK